MALQDLLDLSQQRKKVGLEITKLKKERGIIIK